MKHPTFFAKRVFTILLLCCYLSISAQDILWEKSYGGKHSEYLYDVIPTPDYGFILAGSSMSKKTGNKTEENRGDLDYWVWKMDEHGELDWQKSFGSSGQDMLHSVLLTNDGGFILAGSSDAKAILNKNSSEKQYLDGDKTSKSRGESDFWIIKINAKGGQEWQKTIGGAGQDELNCIIKTTDGGFLLGGSSSSDKSGEKIKDGYGGMDYWVVKIDSKGEIIWQQIFGGEYHDELRSICMTDDGGFILGGSSNSTGTGNKTENNVGESDYWVIKLDKEGNQQWQKSIGGRGDDQLYVVHTAKDGNYILGGNSNSQTDNNKRSSNKNWTDFWVLKIDKETREILWQETYDIAKEDVLTSLIENDDKTILLGGFAQGELEKKKTLIKHEKNLKTIPTNTVENPKIKKGTNDYVAIKIDEKGEELWRKDVGSEGQDVLKKVIETRDGGYLMAGTSKAVLSLDGDVIATGDKSSGKGSDDFWVVKLKDKKKPKVDKKPLEAFPNPAIYFTNVIIGYDFTKGTATLVDLAGHLLQQFEITERTVPLDLHGLPEGIYIVNIKTDKGSNGIKIIKARNKN